MGCGASRPENGGAVAAKFRPLFRFQDINTSALKHKGETTSKKQLLREGEEEEEREEEDDSHKSGGTGEIRPLSQPAPASEMKRGQAEAEEENVAEKPSDKDKDEIGEKELVVPAVMEEEILVVETDTEEDEEEGRIGDDGLFCPGSPSFRVYCIDRLIEDRLIEEEKEEEEDSSRDERNEGKSKEEEDQIIIETQKVSESPDAKSEGDSEIKIKKKGNRVYRLRKVKIPKGKMLRVKSCYYPACAGQQDRTRLLSPKAAAG